MAVKVRGRGGSSAASSQPSGEEKKIEPTPAKENSTNAEATSSKEDFTFSLPGEEKPRKSAKERSELPPDIDVEKKRLKRFGSSRKTQDLTVRQLDLRENQKTKESIFKAATIGLITFLVGIGAYNAVFPEKPMTQQEIAQISKVANGKTKFPFESGRGFAQDFMKAYLSVNSDDAAKQVLNFYKSGSLEGVGSVSTSTEGVWRTPGGSYGQKIVYGPTVYSARSLTDNSGSYTIGALVQPNRTEGQGAKEKTVEGEYQWMFFNVNVYYDEVQQAFSISPDSPSLVPSTEIVAPNKIPKPLPLGNGTDNKDLGTQIKSTVEGYVKGFAATTATDHSAIDQYLAANATADSRKGLNGDYTISDSSAGITYQTYATDDTANTLKVRVKANWLFDPTGSANSGDSDKKSSNQSDKSVINFDSQYVLTLQKTGDRYSVVDFKPEYFAPDIKSRD